MLGIEEMFINKRREIISVDGSDYRIDIIWDCKASVFVAVSDDVPGLVLEDESCDDLMGKVRRAIPELLELNAE